MGADPNPFRYCGEYFDVESGAYYLRARYYDPSIGRFTQEDTHWNTSNMIYGDEPQQIGEYEDPLGTSRYVYAPQITAVMQAGNLYGYGLGNPITYGDYTGDNVYGILLFSANAGFGVGGSVGLMTIWDDKGNKATIVTGYYGGGTPNLGASYAGYMYTSADDIFDFMYGNAIVAGASVKFLTADLILGTGLSGDNFAGYMISIGDSLAPIELHAGISFGELVELSLFQGEPLPEGVSADYFSTLDPQVLEKLLKDLGIEDLKDLYIIILYDHGGGKPLVTTCNMLN